MIQKYFTNPFKIWVKEKIEKVYYELDAKKKKNKRVPFIFFYPNSPDKLSYVISKQQEFSGKCELGLPVPPVELWSGYGSNNDEYLQPGKTQIAKMIELIEKTGYEFQSSRRILDIGCSSGRMIRWLKPYTDKMEIWGTDISSEHIYWANQYLSPPFNFATTTTIPHLPFEDKYFDIIYAGSVFTHIDDLADAWLLELKRILSDNGRIYITIHDRHTIELIENDEVWKNSMLANLLGNNRVFKDNRDNFGLFVGLRGPDSQVFYDMDFFKKMISRTFEILSITEEAYGYQTGVILKRK